MYAQTEAAGAEGDPEGGPEGGPESGEGGGQNGSDKSDEDVVDAEFEDVSKEK